MTEPIRNKSYMFFDQKMQEEMFRDGWRVGLSSGTPVKWAILRWTSQKGTNPKFDSDEAALFHVKAMAAAGSVLHQQALEAVNARNADWEAHGISSHVMMAS